MTAADWRQYICNLCDCTIWAHSQAEATREHGWTWHTGEALCDGCMDDDTTGGIHECWTMATPPPEGYEPQIEHRADVVQLGPLSVEQFQAVKDGKLTGVSVERQPNEPTSYRLILIDGGGSMTRDAIAASVARVKARLLASVVLPPEAMRQLSSAEMAAVMEERALRHLMDPLESLTGKDVTAHIRELASKVVPAAAPWREVRWRRPPPPKPIRLPRYKALVARRRRKKAVARGCA